MSRLVHSMCQPGCGECRSTARTLPVPRRSFRDVRVWAGDLGLQGLRQDLRALEPRPSAAPHQPQMRAGACRATPPDARRGAPGLSLEQASLEYRDRRWVAHWPGDQGHDRGLIRLGAQQPAAGASRGAGLAQRHLNLSSRVAPVACCTSSSLMPAAACVRVS